MDDAELRRGVPSVNAKWGNLVAILSGDFLLARASELAASLGTEVAGLLAATIGRLCEGQVGELKTAFSPDRSEAAIRRRSTARPLRCWPPRLASAGSPAGLPRPSDRRAHRVRRPFRHGVPGRSTTSSTSSPPTTNWASRRATTWSEGIYTLPVLSRSADRVDRGRASPESSAPRWIGPTRDTAPVSWCAHDGVAYATVGRARRCRQGGRRDQRPGTQRRPRRLGRVWRTCWSSCRSRPRTCTSPRTPRGASPETAARRGCGCESVEQHHQTVDADAEPAVGRQARTRGRGCSPRRPTSPRRRHPPWPAPALRRWRAARPGRPAR